MILVVRSFRWCCRASPGGLPFASGRISSAHAPSFAGLVTAPSHIVKGHNISLAPRHRSAPGRSAGRSGTAPHTRSTATGVRARRRRAAGATRCSWRRPRPAVVWFIDFVVRNCATPLSLRSGVSHQQSMPVWMSRTLRPHRLMILGYLHGVCSVDAALGVQRCVWVARCACSGVTAQLH